MITNKNIMIKKENTVYKVYFLDGEFKIIQQPTVVIEKEVFIFGNDKILIPLNSVKYVEEI